MLLNAQIELAARDYIPRLAALEARHAVLRDLARRNPQRHAEALRRVEAALNRTYRANQLVYREEK